MWSRVNATGPRSRPSATASLTASPSRVRSPCPSHAIRAGSPWRRTCVRASSIQSRDPLDVGEQLAAELVDHVEVMIVAGHADPAKRPDPAAEQRPQVAGGEDVDRERVGDARGRRMGADVVAVVEHDRAALAQLQHRADVARHRLQGERLELAGVAATQLGRLLGPDPDRQIAAAQVVGGGQVGDDVGGDIARQQPLQQFGGVAGVGDRLRGLGVAGAGRQREVERCVEIVEACVDDALGLPPSRLLGVGLGDQRDAAEHPRDRDRLGGAHPAEPGRDDQPAAQRAAEVLAGDLRERLVGALQHALGADVLPASGGQPAPGDQVAALEVVEHLRRRPAADEVRVGQQHDRRARSGRQHRDRLARLDDERLTVFDRCFSARTIAFRLSWSRATLAWAA